MTRNIKRFLVTIQILTVFLTVLMFAAGLFVSRTINQSERWPTKPSELDFDEKMRSSIGKPYTAETHYKVMELMRTSDHANASLNESLSGASELMRNLGGILALMSLTSVVLIMRIPVSSKQMESDKLR